MLRCNIDNRIARGRNIHPLEKIGGKYASERSPWRAALAIMSSIIEGAAFDNRNEK
jgi:hypothetical protein